MRWRRWAVATILTTIELLQWPLARAEPPAARPELMSAHRFIAHLNETLVTLPVVVTSFDGQRLQAAFQLTHFRPPGAGPFPMVVVHHGRSRDNSYPSRFRGGVFVDYFVARGFAVLVLTRAGYGGLGKAIDPEGQGSGCNVETLEQQIDSVVAHTRAALEFAATQSWADPKRTIIVGGSVGGYTSIAAASREIPGLIAAINFAGGAGGNPKKNPGAPCIPERLSTLFSKIGGSVPVPTLWVYAENDKYWGAKYPREWHRAFVKSGGRGEFVMLGPIGDDGHTISTSGFPQWRPIVDGFLTKYVSAIGFTVPRTPNAPPPTEFAPLDDAARVPSNEAGKSKGYPRFLAADIPRAFVVAPNGGWAAQWGKASALDEALKSCESAAKQPCKPYAIDDNVVWVP
jgi:dienelactone hydrolase